MAQTITNDDLQNQNNQQNQQQGQQQVGSFNSPSSGGQGQNSNNQQQNNQQNQQNTPQSYSQQKQGSGYTNIQKILEANKQNQLGQNVASNVQQAGQQAQGGIQQSQQQFQQQTGQNQFNTNANQSLIQKGLMDPTSLTPQEQQQFQTLISGQYAGPTQLGNQDVLGAKTQYAQQLGQALGSAGGQVGLLQQLFNKPTYTSGQQNLDQLLLSQTGGPALTQAKRSVMGLGQQLGTAEAGAQAQGQEQTGQAQGFGQDTQQQFGKTVGDINTQLTQQAQKAQTDRDAAYQKAISDLQSGNITQAEASMLGISGGQQFTGDVLKNIGSFLTEDPTKASAQNVANAQDYAKIDALRKLGGQYSPQDAAAILGQYSGQNSQAGQFDAKQAFTADQAGFQKAAQAQMQNYQSQLAPSQTKMQSMQELNDLYNQQMAANRAGNQQQAIAIDAQIRSKFPGAVGGDFAHNVNWARQQLEQATQGFNATRDALQKQFGGFQTINITPEQAAAASGGNASIQPVGQGPISIMPQGGTATIQPYPGIIQALNAPQ